MATPPHTTPAAMATQKDSNMATTITRTQALIVFTMLDVPTANKWAVDRLTKKVNNIADLVTDVDYASVNPEGAAILKQIQDEIAAGGAVAVADDGTGTTAKAAKAEKAAKPAKEAAPKLTDEEKAAAKAAKEAEKAAAKAAKEAEKAAAEPATPRIPGVRPNPNSRTYIAAYLIALNGHEKGIEEEMVAMIDIQTGKANPVQTKFDLSGSWHAIDGYLAGLAAKEAGETYNPLLAIPE